MVCVNLKLHELPLEYFLFCSMLISMKSESVHYFKDLNNRLLGDHLVGELSHAELSRHKSRVTFKLEKEFNRFAPYVLFDFLSELYGEFGKPIVPIAVLDEPFSCTSYTPEIRGWDGQDFRHSVLENRNIHEIFNSFNVSEVSFNSFPKPIFNLGNVRCEHFTVDSSGHPTPF